uniref:Bax inhibitor 1 n=1 Tax=Arcella intermedia TaxID=1963864 RepID=A0A6B2LFS9_9EUKA
MGDISIETHNHLKKVYGTLLYCCACAAVGAWSSPSLSQGAALLCFLLGIALLALLAAIPHDPTKTQWPRLALLGAFAAAQGVAIGPLIAIVHLHYGQDIILAALLIAASAFLALTLLALCTPRRALIFLLAPLLAGLQLLLLFSFVNVFAGSDFLFAVGVYMGLMVFLGFVAVDTQLMVERAEGGERDYVWQAVGLFLDLLNVFVRVVVVLARLRDGESRERGFDIEAGKMEL